MIERDYAITFEDAVRDVFGEPEAVGVVREGIAVESAGRGKRERGA